MEYVRSFLSAAALVSVASALSPTRETVRRAVLSALSVILLFLLIPRGEGVSLDALLSFDTEEAVTEPSDLLDAAWQEGVTRGIRDDLSQKYGIDRENVTVLCTLKNESGEVVIEHLSLTLSGKAALADATGMLTYIEKSYGVYAEIHLKA